MATFADDLRLAHVLADAVERYTLEMFHSADLEVSVKDDGSLVTQADRHTEELLRHQLGRTRTRDVVQGEELPTTGHGSRRWVLDPIDGTTNYIRGVPVWATLIALVVDDEPVLGLVSAPALSRRWWAAVGSGAWTGRTLSSAREIQVSDTTVLEHASLSHAALDKWWRPPPAARASSPWPSGAGAPAATATSGPTCSSPRAPSTSASTPPWRCMTWPRSHRS